MDNFTRCLDEIDRQRESDPPFREWCEAFNALSQEEKEAIRDEVLKIIDGQTERIYGEAWEETYGKTKRADTF